MAKLHGFTLIELLVVVAIIAVLVSMLLPALGSAREAVRSADCTSNLRQLVVGMIMYTDEYSEHLPKYWDGSESWIAKIMPYLGNPQANFRCKSSDYVNLQPDTFWKSAYGINYYAMQWYPYPSSLKLSTIENPTQCVLVGDAPGCGIIVCTPDRIGGSGQQLPDFRHKGMGNFGFSDGHSGSLSPEASGKYTLINGYYYYWHWDPWIR